MVSDLAGAVVRHVADRDAAPRARRKIDVVETDARAHDQAAVRHAVEQAVIHRNFVIDHQRVAGRESCPGSSNGPIRPFVKEAQRDIGAASERGSLDNAIVSKARIGIKDADDAHPAPSQDHLLQPRADPVRRPDEHDDQEDAGRGLVILEHLHRRDERESKPARPDQSEHRR